MSERREGLARRLGLVALILLLARLAPRRRRERLLPDPPRYRAAPERLVTALLWAAAVMAACFVGVYVWNGQPQLLGASLGLALAALAAALSVAGARLVPQEEAEMPVHEKRHPEAEEDVSGLLVEGTQPLSRRGLLLAAGAAGTALGAAVIVPAASLGPSVGQTLVETPWRAGRRLVDEAGRPIAADTLEVGSFTTAFPEGADREWLAAPVVVLRIRPDELRLPAARHGWAPRGLMAFSKICTHAGCAIALFRYPLYRPTSPGPALVCPCHYSTFDVTRGGVVVFGPAVRSLPQLPLRIDGEGHLVAGGDLSGPVGPSWWAVRRGR